MADLVGLIGFPSFIGVSVVLGVRPLRLAGRTRKLPELAISLNFLLGAGVGYSLLIAARGRDPQASRRRASATRWRRSSVASVAPRG